jgi:hypothetical protein
MSSVEVKTIRPIQSMVPMPVSTSKHILKRRSTEILPNEQNEFTYTGNDRIIFNLSSSTELLNTLESYIKLKVTTTGNDARHFDEGGVHSLFKTIELRTQNGTLIQRYERYNRWYAIKSNLYHSADYIQYHGAAEGDSLGVGKATDGRKLAAQNDTEYCFRPAISFMEQPNYIPLMFIKQGLQLVLELDRPQFALSQGGDPADVKDDALNYTISEPRFVAMLTTPDEEIIKGYMSMFNGKGINLQLEGVRHRKTQFSGTESAGYTANLHFGVRSARKVFAVVQSSTISENSSSKSCQANNSLSTFLRTGIISYIFKTGSEEYPNKEVNCSIINNELMKQQLLTTNQIDKIIPSFRFTPDKLMASNTIKVRNLGDDDDVDVEEEVVKFIMCARMERDDSPFTGTDLSLNPLDVELRFDSAANVNFGDRNLNVFVAYDSLLSISGAGVIIRS